jgi:predicted TIM-barrel fold metal-dependent hydrolase
MILHVVREGTVGSFVAKRGVNLKIDSHVHITPPGITANWQKYAEKEPYFSLLSNAKHNMFASADDAASMLEKEGFDKAVVFGFAFRDLGLCSYVNDYVIESVKKFPDKLIGFAVAPPAAQNAAKEIERCFSAGLKGVGELFPAGQEIDLVKKEAVMDIANTCVELNIPLLLHANETLGHDYAGKTDVPMRHLETFVTNNPNLKIILAHFGGGIFIYETMKEIKEKFKNVYYDTAVTPFIYDERIYSAAKAVGLCERILFGSDFPILPPLRYMDGLNKSALSEEEKVMILGENARKLFFIPSE